MSEFTFNRSDRLKSRKSIAGLFQSSFSYGKAPIRILWKVEQNSSENYTCKVVIAVPKRKIKKAVQRNRIKRLIKEAYRLNKSDICSFLGKKGLSCNLGILYVSDDMPTYKVINERVKKLMDKFPSEYEKHFK